MKNRLLTMLILMFSTSFIFAQSDVSGVVTDGSMNEPFAFASVYLKGTTVGTTTDIDGNYEISIPSDISNPILVFQFMGYASQEITVNGKATINVTLDVDAAQLDEVVVTSFGIKRERKALNYAVQDVKADEIVKTKETNVINSLRGKVAGVQITASSGSPGASTQILIRGASSVSAGSNNQPLFIVDGVIVSNAASNGGGNRGMDIDPDDIESMTVLKGPAAAALYGWNASNGAIVITTKSGKSGKISVDFGIDAGFSTALGVPDIQNKYSQGENGNYGLNVPVSWGSYIEDKETYQNVDNFLETGYLQKYNLALKGGSKKLTYMFSGNVIDQSGVVPVEKYSKYGGLAKIDYAITDKLKIGISINWIKTNNDRVPYGFMGSMYRWPISRDMRRFEKSNGDKIWLVNVPEDPNDEYAQAKGNSLENPYWALKYNSINSEVLRSISTFYVNWDIAKGLNLNYRVGYDNTKELYKRIQAKNSAGSNYKGYMRQDTLRRQILNSNMILSYNTALTDKLNMSSLVGNSIEMTSADNMYYTGRNYITDENQVNPDNFENIEVTPSTAQVRGVGVFGRVGFDYDNIYFLDITGRNDWSSTLSPGMNSFFYPSITFGAIVSEYFNEDLKKTFSYLKLRANYAAVGKATAPERTRDKLEEYRGIGGGYNKHYIGGNWNIKPERSTSYEFGFETRLWEGKTHFDLTYYYMNSYDQIITNRVSPTSGFVMMTFNAGDITNKGLEIFLNQKVIEKADFEWSMGFNYSHNKSILANLPSFMSKMIVTEGQVISVARPSSEINMPVTGIDGTVALRTKEGSLVVDEYGLPRVGTYVFDENGNYVDEDNDGEYDIDYTNKYLGDREPDFSIGFSNTFTYKNWDFSFLLDIRKGGDVINATGAKMTSYGMSGLVNDHRNEQIIVDGVVEQTDGGFTENSTVTPVDRTFFTRYNSIGENIVEDGSWVKLRNIRLGYYYKPKNKKFFKSLNFAVTVNNAWIWTKYSGADPETNAGGSEVGGAGTQGLDNFNTPSVRSYNFSVRASF